LLCIISDAHTTCSKQLLSQVEIRIDTWVGTTSWCVYGVIFWNRFSHSKMMISHFILQQFSEESFAKIGW